MEEIDVAVSRSTPSAGCGWSTARASACSGSPPERLLGAAPTSSAWRRLLAGDAARVAGR